MGVLWRVSIGKHQSFVLDLCFRPAARDVGTFFLSRTFESSLIMRLLDMQLASRAFAPPVWFVSRVNKLGGFLYHSCAVKHLHV
jgi:hypothetical protein